MHFISFLWVFEERKLEFLIVTLQILWEELQEYLISKPKPFLREPVLHQIIMGPIQVEVLSSEKQ